MRAYQRHLDEIRALGATLVAISPELPDGTLTMAEVNALGFDVLSDGGNAVARSYGLVFRIADELVPLYASWDIVLPERNGDDSWELPVPGTFVIDRAGRIEHAFAEPDHTRRLEPRELLAALARAAEAPA